ncbi:MAG: XdhC family protein [Acetivibrio ethanolgignens]
MRNMLNTMKDRLVAGEDLVLVTVIASSGATPRGAGARMLSGKQGRICGTIGGGAVEYRSEAIAKTVLENKSSYGHDFTLTKDDVQNLGMICGGTCNVFFHYIPTGDSSLIALAEEAERRFAKGEELWLISDIAAGGKLFLAEKSEEALAKHLTRHPHRVQEDGKDLYIEQINTSGRVYIFGGGHVAQELVPVLSHVGFRCVVMDDRKEFTRPNLFSAAEEIILGDFCRISDYCTIGSEDYVCVMTRGHAYDTLVQAQVLRCCPAYCGVIGSVFKAAGVRKTLKEEYGLLDEELALVTTPIGLNIKAETPAEIAVSIAAQMILHRAERNGL